MAMFVRSLILDESGFIISSEFALIITLAFCAAAVGYAVVKDSLVGELNDLSEMVGVTSQSFNVTGIRKAKDNGKPHAECSGFGFNDNADACDCQPVTFIEVCGKNDPSATGVSEQGV